MEREIEVKVLHVDLDEMGAKLVDLGGEKIGEEHQTNYLIDSIPFPQISAICAFDASRRTGAKPFNAPSKRRSAMKASAPTTSTR